ncbi:MAG: hypothetical protein NTW61_03890 [Candidatus Melainabacteria bacterium]|nr:hypothetical protein [Candidatus Melainabacteria bacterium]
MFFLPLRWTKRIGDCRANAMVVSIGWCTIQSLNSRSSPSNRGNHYGFKSSLPISVADLP